MEIVRIMSLLQGNGYQPARFFKVIGEKGANSCDRCLRFAETIFVGDDPQIPIFPLHPNCNCRLVEVDQAEYAKQNRFQFGEMTHDQWGKQEESKKYLWCNIFRIRFGSAIDKYAREYNIPKQLLAGVIANEMLEWKFPDGTRYDGISGGGVGYAQIAIKTARKHGATGTDAEIRKKLNSYDGSVEIAAKILKVYLEEFRRSMWDGKLGKGYTKSALYCVRPSYILEKESIVDISVPQWLLNTMCAVWNSGIEVIYAKDKLGDNNYRNAYWHGMNSCTFSRFLPKLVNE